MATYYAEPVNWSADRFDMRQTRFKDQRQTHGGSGHPHDVCATGFTADELRALCDRHGFDCDLSALGSHGGAA